ncbi:unnamed protein product [Pipistrellus nathusii]|uniref:Uncharacterized protein n=1 Tax=Pipistrellus nathusii TaxID=59473 RepID=A0ABN9ZCD7_PIPNA
MSSFLSHLRVSHRCQALTTVSDCPSLPAPAFVTEQPVGRVGLPSNFMPTSLCPHNPSSLSATTFLLAKTVPDLLFLGVDLKDLKAETGLAQRIERRRRSQVSGLTCPGDRQLTQVCDRTMAPQALHPSSEPHVQTGGWREPLRLWH